MTPEQRRQNADNLMLRAAKERDPVVSDVLIRTAHELRKPTPPKTVRGSFRTAGGHAFRGPNTSVISDKDSCL